VGFTAQPRFVNAVVELETVLGPRELLDGLLAIEKEFGRDRTAGFKNGPRTLDLDILLLGELEISEAGVEIPHPRLAERAFVLVPLCEMAAGVIVPGCGETVQRVFARLREGALADVDAMERIESAAWPSR
jgi:2-amino-4-hydroxy-6-hydroxymethyldihydropteridine diphosphokinase